MRVKLILEQTGIASANFTFICYTPNRFEYRSVTYATTDLFFRAHLPAGAEPSINEESTDFLWVTPDAFDPALLAFDSVKAAYPHDLAHRKAADQWVAIRCVNATHVGSRNASVPPCQKEMRILLISGKLFAPMTPCLKSTPDAISSDA